MKHYLSIEITLSQASPTTIIELLLDENTSPTVLFNHTRLKYWSEVQESSVKQTNRGISCNIEVQYEWQIPPYSLARPTTDIIFGIQQSSHQAIITDRWEQAAQKGDWKNLAPDEDLRVKLPFSRNLRQKEWYWLTRGITPLQMEDKWFAYVENNQLFYHRSWTGQCIFMLELDEQYYKIKNAWSFYRIPPPSSETGTLHALVDDSCREAAAVLDV